jgi:hypothetical protein
MFPPNDKYLSIAREKRAGQVAQEKLIFVVDFCRNPYHELGSFDSSSESKKVRPPALELGH